MNKKILMGAGAAALCVALVAAPAYTQSSRQHKVVIEKGPEIVVQEPEDVLFQGPDTETFNLAIGDGGSWLGVETQEVTGEKAKELKLPAERGALLGKVAPDSPASKAGLKDGDVVLELNGQHVEGAMQFRRMIREIPAGRNVQLTVWRDGRSQSISATLGKSEEMHRRIMKTEPGTFAFHMPDVPELGDLPEVAEIPGMPSMEWHGNMMYAGHPRLGIDAEELSGQLGSYFGAPDGEGILVREVNSGTPAEKAGLKAGDVITSVNGERIHSIGDLRQKLTAKRGSEKDADKEAKDRSVKLGLLRNRSEMSVNVELPAPEAGKSTKRIINRRTNI
jgi:serine protease Do